MIVVASDIHGSLHFTRILMKRVEELKPDALIILGDLYYHGPRNNMPDEYNPSQIASILNKYNKEGKLIVIKGNCDAEVDEMISDFEFHEFYEFEAYKKTFALTHGHKINIQNMDDIYQDVLLYGHFHVPFIENSGATIVASPGSTSLPKEGSKPSYMTIDECGIQIRNLEDNVVTLSRNFF